MQTFGNRERIIGLVSESPGIHLREIQRQSGLSFSTVRYHADRLTRDGDVEICRLGRYKGLFPRGFASSDMDKALLLRQPTFRMVAVQLLTKKTSNGEISRATGLAKSTVSEKTAAMARIGIIERSPLEPHRASWKMAEGALALLRRHGGLAVQSTVDRYVDLWGF